MRYILGILGFIAGLLLVVYREPAKRFIGDISWFETHFGPGGTYTGLMLIGLATSILSVLFITGTMQEMLQKLLGPIFGI